MKKNIRLKKPADSEVTMTEIVFSHDTNPMGIIQGGRIIQLMDIACAICAQNHSNKIAVTASIDQVSFNSPARLGDILTIKAKITRVFTTSMEIHAQVWTKRLPDMKSVLTNEAYFIFVVLGNDGRPIQIVPLKPITVTEKAQYAAALKRKQMRQTQLH
ncbi:MAG: acyl-CoA thioesterase [Bacteroidia bacterium]|nr:acyl-CoA thioesterase [Bacteroidia bacterium]